MIEILDMIAKEVGFKTPYAKVAEKLVTELNLMARSSEGKVRYEGQTLVTFFRAWSDHKDDLTKIASKYRTSDEVRQFIRDNGRDLLNKSLNRTEGQELSDSEVERIRKIMIITGDYPMRVY